MKYYTCKKYIESIQNDLLELDFFYEDKLLLKKTTKLMIDNEICLLVGLKHPDSNFNAVLQNQIDFLEDCLTLI